MDLQKKILLLNHLYVRAPVTPNSILVQYFVIEEGAEMFAIFLLQV